MDFSDLHAFLAVAETGGFGRAAARLNTTTASISRRVTALERAVGTRLLHRTTRRVTLTEAGARFRQDVSAILDALEEARERAAGEQQAVTGTLRLTAPLALGTRVLAPLLGRFRARYPSLRLAIDLDNRFTDLVAAGFDLALRIGTLADSSLVARPLARVPFLCVAAPAYLTARGRPAHPEALAGHACLHYDNIDPREEWRFPAPQGDRVVAVSGPVTANNDDVLLAAVLAGEGIAILPAFVVAPDLAAGTLEQVLPAHPLPPKTLYGVWPSRGYTPSRVRALVAFLEGALITGGGPGGVHTFSPIPAHN